MKQKMSAIRDALEKDGLAREKVSKAEVYPEMVTVVFTEGEDGGTRGRIAKPDGTVEVLDNKTSMRSLSKRLQEDDRLIVESYRNGTGAYRSARVYAGNEVLEVLRKAEEDDD